MHPSLIRELENKLKVGGAETVVGAMVNTSYSTYI